MTDRLLVKVDVAPESQRGTILATVKGLKEGPMTVKVGDVVLYRKYADQEIGIQGIKQ